MPEIKRFCGFKILMFFQDETPHTFTSRARISRQKSALLMAKF